MSECTMNIHGATKTDNQSKLAQDPNASTGPGLFDPCFMSSLAPALQYLKSNNVKLAVNAGASDAELLAREVKKEVNQLNLDLKVAWIEGDEVTAQVQDLRSKGDKFVNLDTGKNLEEWGHEPVYAQ